MSHGSNTQFLNVDLDIEVASDLDAFLGSLGPSIEVLHKGTTQASIELGGVVAPLEETILGFVALVDALPPDARSIWDQAIKRSMNIGIQAGAQPRSTEFTISSECVAKLATIGAEVVLTVYAVQYPSFSAA